jgi:pimeloyl-ACP methyl ester carboxylesterase
MCIMNYTPPPAQQSVTRITTTISQADWNTAKRRARLPNGISLAYVELGNPKGRPVLLVHGYTDSSRSWSLPAPHLAEWYRLILVDLRGHGASSAPECCYTISDMTYDLRLLLDHLKIDKVDFVGHSLGSMIGQMFAQRYSERLRKLVLVGSTLSVVKAGAPGSWLWENVHALTDPIDQGSAFIGEWTTNPMPVDAEFIAYERREACAMPTRVWRAVLQEMYVSEFGRLSPMITTPTLILWGGKDPLFGGEDQAELRKTIKDSEFIAFETLGHNLQWEDPAGVAAAIATFLG